MKKTEKTHENFMEMYDADKLELQTELDEKVYALIRTGTEWFGLRFAYVSVWKSLYEDGVLAFAVEECSNREVVRTTQSRSQVLHALLEANRYSDDSEIQRFFSTAAEAKAFLDLEYEEIDIKELVWREASPHLDELIEEHFLGDWASAGELQMNAKSMGMEINFVDYDEDENPTVTFTKGSRYVDVDASFFEGKFMLHATRPE